MLQIFPPIIQSEAKVFNIGNSNWCLTKMSLNAIDTFPHLPDRRMQCGVDTNMFGKITEIPLPGHTNTFYHHIKPGNSFCVLKHEKNCKCCLVLLLLPSGQIEIIVINSVSKTIFCKLSR